MRDVPLLSKAPSPQAMQKSVLADALLLLQDVMTTPYQESACKEMHRDARTCPGTTHPFWCLVDSDKFVRPAWMTTNVMSHHFVNYEASHTETARE